MANTEVTYKLSGQITWDDVEDKPSTFPPDLSGMPEPISNVTVPQTWVVPGAVSVPSGDTNVIPYHLISIPTGNSATLKGLRYTIGSGTSATFKLQQNGVDIAGMTGLNATTANSKTAGDVTLADGDKLQPIVTAISGSPKNMSISLIMEYGG